jgi:DNA-binding CsgD family transcriptional regulator/PAS domain-containing protein
MLSLDDFSDIVSRIYDASMEVIRWDDALTPLLHHWASDWAQIVFARNLRELSFIRHAGDVAHFAPYLGRYIELTPTDPRTTSVRFKAVHCRQVVSDEELWASDMYKEALKPVGIEYSMYMIVPLGEGLCSLGAMRSASRIAYTGADCEDMSRLSAHLARACETYKTFQLHRRETEVVRAAIDGVPLGMMVIDDGDIALANTAARSILEGRDTLHAHNGRLRANAAQIDAELRDAVRQASDDASRIMGIALPAGDSNDPVHAVMRKIPPDAAGMLGTDDGSVAVYLTDPRRPIETREEILQRLFGLTQREASVLQALVYGHEPRAIAGHLGISYDTVRDHLKSIMQTTNVRRQADLVRLVLSSPAWVASQMA